MAHVQDALQGFLLQLQADGRSPHTVGQYRRHVTSLNTWMTEVDAGDQVDDLTPELREHRF